MRFQPLTEEEIQIQSLLPEGVYSYEMSHAEEKISKAGNEYISCILRVWDDQGKVHQVFTNLSLIKLLKHFCDINNLQNEYQSGHLPAELLLGKNNGCVVIGIEDEKPNGTGGFYRAKNIVKDYVIAPQRSLSTPLTPKNDLFDDDKLPF